jgi:hypothetical protein
MELLMISYNELKEKCNCWTGYKRKPGTKPCAEDSCMKEELEKHHVLAFGRMNPITSGHEAVVNKLHSVAKEHGASHSLVVSHSQDAKKNPLTGEQKVAHAKNAFPGTKVSSASKESPTILHHAAAAHAAGATHLHVIAGSDRHEEMHNLLHKYNGKDAAHGHYNFKKITVHSSGERDPDAEGTTGISASKMREHAASGNKAEFHKGAPSKMKPEHKDAMYNDVRKGMNIKEQTVQETLRPEMGAQTYINDFIASTNPKFNNKSKEERRKMAIGAFMAAKARGVKEQIDLEEGTFKYHMDKAVAAHMKGDSKKAMYHLGNAKTARYAMPTKDYAKNKDLFAKYKQMSEEVMTEDNGHYEEAEEHLSKANDADAKGDKLAFHGHMADHHDSMSQWHESKGRSASADKHAEKADYHSDKYTQHANGVNEGTLQGNIGGGDAMNTTTSAPSGSTTKDTTMNKKVKGFKFFNGETDKQMNMNQPVKESINDNLHPAGAALLKHIKPEHHNKYKEHLTTGVFTGSYKDRSDVLNAAKKAGHLKEDSKKEDPPFDGPYKSTFKKPNNPNRTGMDAARSLAQRAMDQLNPKKPVKEAKDEQEYGYEGDMALNQLATLTRCAEMIKDTLKPDTDLPEWVQSKITLATDYIQTAADYLYSESEVNEQAPVAPVPDRKYIKGTPEHKAYKATKKPINGMPTNVKEETLDEKSEQAKQNKTMKNMMDASRGARFKVQNKLTGDAVRDWDGKHKTAQAQNKAIGRALRNEAMAQKGVNVDKVNHAGDTPHEEKWETAPKTVSKLKKVKEENMKSYKEFLQSLDEKLIGKQHKIDKNKNNKVDAEDFELLRKEEADHLLEYESDESGVYRHTKKATYGTSYQDPEGADETAADMKKKEKKAAGRKTGQSTGSYKPRATMSKLKSAGATYK